MLTPRTKFKDERYCFHLRETMCLNVKKQKKYIKGIKLKVYKTWFFSLFYICVCVIWFIPFACGSLKVWVPNRKEKVPSRMSSNSKTAEIKHGCVMHQWKWNNTNTFFYSYFIYSLLFGDTLGHDVFKLLNWYCFQWKHQPCFLK